MRNYVSYLLKNNKILLYRRRCAYYSNTSSSHIVVPYIVDGNFARRVLSNAPYGCFTSGSVWVQTGHCPLVAI